MESHGIIYQVTLPSGVVATNPSELALARMAEGAVARPIITDDGRVLEAPRPLPERDEQLSDEPQL